jgi:hypothetical protein
MRTPPTFPAEAYAPDADRAGSKGSAHAPEWVVLCIAMLIHFLLEHVFAARLRRSSEVQPWWQERRPDLPAGSAQAEAASIRGAFGNAIAWMCRRHGVGPGHKDWPELSRAIVAFGGSVNGARAGVPASGLQWWENPNIVPGIVPGFGAPAPAATMMQREAVANAAPPAPNAVQTDAAHARLPASWVSASGLSALARQGFARAGPCPPTGPPGCPGLPSRSCLHARGRSTAGPAVLIRAR